MVRKIFYLFTLLLVTSSALADVFLSINPRSGSMTQSYTLGVTVRGDSTSLPPTIQENDDFTVRYVGPQQSVKIINGSVTSETTFFYKLRPKHDGMLLTPEVSVSLSSGVVRPDSLRVEVTKGETLSDGSGGQREILFEQKVTPEEVYAGEQVLDTTQILTPLELRNLRVDSPTTSDFWEESIRPDERDQEVRGGHTYSVMRMRRAIFPLKSGTLTVPSRTMTAQAVRSNSGSLLDDMDPFNSNFLSNFFSAHGEEISLASNEASIKVKELPSVPQNLPLINGSPLVGATSLSASVDAKQINPGEGKVVTITLSTTGNASSITDLPIPEDERWKIYTEQPSATTDFKNGKVSFKKIFKVNIVPTSGGDLEIPSIGIGYFDPAEERYKVAETGTIRIAVSGTPQPAKPSAIKTKASPLHKEETASQENIVENSSLPSSRSLIGLLGIALLAIGLYSYIKKPSSPEIKSIGSVKRSILPEEQVNSLSLLYRTFLEAIDLRFSREFRGGGTGAAARTILKERLLDAPLRFEIESFLDELEENLYGAKQSEDAASFDELKARAFKLMQRW